MAYNPFRHFWLKAVAVGIAVLLWIAVGGEKQVERSLRAPLELQNVPSALELVGDAPSAVDVRVRGSSSTLGRLAQGDVMAVLDVGTARPGRNLFHLAPSSVRVPFDVDVTYTGPATVPLVFERQVSKTVPVVPAVEGDPAPGYAVGRVVVDPAEVEVVGPESALRDLHQATTDTVELKASAGRVRESVTIGIVNSAARLRNPRSAVVTVDIQPIHTERTIESVPVRMQNLRTGLTARSAPSNVTVVIRGDEGALRALDRGAIDAVVDLNGIGVGSYVVPVRMTPLQAVGVVRIVPAEVQITIR
jgi:YbbR domain-containing protein